MIALTAAQERNYRAGISVARNLAEAERITFAKMTESNGRVLANDGAAFHPDPEVRRPGWDKDENGRPLPARMIAALYAELRTSLELPHDGIGNNGGSTGDIQQLSQSYVAIRFPGKTWGYGSIAQTMDPVWSATALRSRLIVTDNREYAGLEFDPIAADVLRVQQPKVSEHESDNYNAAQVARAKAIVAQLSNPKPPDTEWVIDMADQAALDKFRGQISEDTFRAVADVLHSPEFSGVSKAASGETVHHTVVAILRAPEFDLGAVNAKLDRALDQQAEILSILKEGK